MGERADVEKAEVQDGKRQENLSRPSFGVSNHVVHLMVVFTKANFAVPRHVAAHRPFAAPELCQCTGIVPTVPSLQVSLRSRFLQNGQKQFLFFALLTRL